MGLKGITIETPPQAEAHINAADDRAIWEAVIGMDGVVNVGQKLKATLISNNLLRVYDGTLVVGGAVGRIPFGEYEDITINNGTQNQLRNDLVVAQIEANGAIENMKLHYIQGVPGEVAKDPDYTVGNVYEGETLRQYPLYRVKLNGLNVEAVEPLFEVLPNLGKVKDEVGELNRKLESSFKSIEILAHAVTSGTFPIKDITQFKTMYLAFFYSGTYFLTELNPHIMLFNDSFIGKNLEFGRVGTNTGYSIGGSVRFASTTSFVMGNWTVNGWTFSSWMLIGIK